MRLYLKRLIIYGKPLISLNIVVSLLHKKKAGCPAFIVDPAISLLFDDLFRNCSLHSTDIHNIDTWRKVAQ
jgi:hypothetical protein